MGNIHKNSSILKCEIIIMDANSAHEYVTSLHLSHKNPKGISIIIRII